jgi:hypothetical protein
MAVLTVMAMGPARSQNAVNDERRMSCTTGTASLVALGRNFEERGLDVKPDASGSFPKPTQDYLRALCPRLKELTSATERDCDPLSVSSDLVKELPRIEAMKFARTATPLCDAYTTLATATPQQQPAVSSPASSQGTNDREPGDTRVMSCTRNTASLLVLSRELDAEADNLKAEGDKGFSPSTRVFFETLCPKVRRHTAAVDRDCDELRNSDDMAKNFPRVEALMFARKTVPFCDQFFKASAVQALPERATVPPGGEAGGTNARAMACTRHVASASQIRLEADTFGPSLKAAPDGRFTQEVRASLERICPSLRQHAAAMETNCDKLPQTSDVMLRERPRFEVEHFLQETLPLCDRLPTLPAAPPSRSAAGNPMDDVDVLAQRCIGQLKTAVQLQWDFGDYFTKGAGKADLKSGKATPRITRYFQRLCPKLRNAAGFRDIDCKAVFSVVDLPIEKDHFEGVTLFAGDILSSCERDFTQATLSAADYQKHFDREVRKKRYPETVSAVCENGEPRYSAVFEPMPKGTFGFYAHHGASDDAFRRQDTNYTAAGLQRVWHNRIECGGRPYNQAVWTSK